MRRRIFVALAALALVAVLLQPACEAWLAHAGAAAGSASQVAGAPFGHDGDPQCCAIISDIWPVAPLQAASGNWGTASGVTPAALASTVTAVAILTRQLHWLRAPPRRPQSFYLRSARVLR
jgi:hypothetical protein